LHEKNSHRYALQGRRPRILFAVQPSVVVVTGCFERTEALLATSKTVTADKKRFILRSAEKEELEIVAEMRARIFNESRNDPFYYRALRKELLAGLKSTFRVAMLYVIVCEDTLPDELHQSSPTDDFIPLITPHGRRLVGSVDVAFLPPRRGTLLEPEMLPYRAYISNLTVDVNYRRLGIGRQLLHECDDMTRQMKAQMMYLHVLEDNKVAQAVYERNGFQADKVDSAWQSILLRRPRRIRYRKDLDLDM